jgi:REP element-mobilizing transposase RayT
MKYQEATSGNDKENWDEAVIQEHERMKDHKAWEVHGMNEIPSETKVITSTWAMKKKSNRVYRA